MSIAAVKKITIIGPNTLKSNLLIELQELGCLHLIALNPADKSALTTQSTTLLDQIKMALHYLQDSPEKGNPRLIWKNFNSDQAVQDILNNQRLLRESNDRRDFLIKRIKAVSEWGHFQLPDENEMGSIKLWFYKINIKDIRLLPKDKPLQEVYRDNRYVFLIVMSEHEPKEDDFPSPRIHTGSVALNALREELNELNERIDDLLDERRNLTRYRFLLAREVAQFADRTHLKKANEQTHDLNELFIIQGWVPVTHLTSLTQWSDNHQVALVIEDPLPDELPPTLLQTHHWFEGGQELVNFYQTPGYHSLDPSTMVFFSFSVFFAMILADAGYGLFLALFTVLTWKKLTRSSHGRWLKPLLVVISLFSMIYGVLIGSYWGVEPQPDTLLSKLHIIHINDFKSMMGLVIVVGCLHVSLANGLKIIHGSNWSERIQPIGFILLIVSVLLFTVAIMHGNATLKLQSEILLAFSLLLIMIFASSEPVTSVSSLFKRMVHGVSALAEITTLFGDVLSYLRLFALGLAGASLAITFNTLAVHISKSAGWVPGVIILILGQSLNFILCLMSAVIHGLRLNYIEFFKWCIKEDGYHYNPLKKQEISHE